MHWFTVNVIDLRTGECVDGIETESHNADFAIVQAREELPQYDNDDYEFEIA